MTNEHKEPWTPGPWKVKNGCVYSADKLVASFGFNVRVGSDEDDANQRLTAQAPAMAELLERLVNGACYLGVRQECAIVEDAKVLLSRARGEGRT